MGAITVVLNSNNTKRFAVLLNAAEPARARILREAQNKFRVKALSVVYLAGGQLLVDDDLQDGETQVWVSKGEPYSGPTQTKKGKQKGEATSEVRLIASKSFVDDAALTQLNFVAQLPGVSLAIGFPDLHPGSRFPIGCSLAAEGIYPALIGSDVGCGIALYEVTPNPKSIPNPQKLASALQGLEEPWSGSPAAWLADYGITRESPFDASSLGTVGAGNHFAELCTVEKVVEDGALDVCEGGLYLLVHTGSRGLGSSVLAAETVAESNPYIPSDSPHSAEYLEKHDHCVAWARANRDLVAHRIVQCIIPSDAPTKPRKLVDVTHNSVTKHSLTIGESARDLWVHRKGAAPADQGIAPCPGSRGHLSYLLRPTGDGQHNAFSLAHGAGRRYGRNAMHTGTKTNKASLTQTALGSVVVCEDPALLIEEQPDAYKDVECVVEDMVDAGICTPVAVLRPLVTYKVRKEYAAPLLPLTDVGRRNMNRPRSGVVQNKLHQLRGENFRHQLNLHQTSRAIHSQTSAPTLPANLFSDAAYSEDKPRRAHNTREALFVVNLKQPAGADSESVINAEERASVLGFNEKPQHRVPKLTLLCLRLLVEACSDEALEQLCRDYVPGHLRRDLLRWAAMAQPLPTRTIKALCGDQGHVDGELIVVGPDAELHEGHLRAATDTDTCSSADWDTDDSSTQATTPMRRLILISTSLSLSLMLVLPRTLTSLALVNLQRPVSLHRLPATCPLLEDLDLSYNTWLASEREAEEHLGKVTWSRCAHLTRIALRRCSIPASIVRELNRGKWDEVQVIQ
uniref:3'-phosphate/5'-hydroxy nucleic acid ligase n=1 Tax=Mycena chlorophos TaxID=658473 RepID=A0ABQ0LQ74_MYCCL|nr:release factor H-coupled R [Mycena chlorophos]